MMETSDIGSTEIPQIFSEEDDLLPNNNTPKPSAGTKLKSLLLSKIPSLHDVSKYTKLTNKSSSMRMDDKEDFSIAEDASEEEKAEQRTTMLPYQHTPALSIGEKVKLIQTISNFIAVLFFIGGALSLAITAFMVIPVFVVPTQHAASYMMIWALTSIVLLFLAMLMGEFKWYAPDDSQKIKCRILCCSEQQAHKDEEKHI